MRNGWKLILISAALTGCGTVAVQEGGGAATPTPSPSATLTPTPTPVPTATPPSQTMFDANVQPILDGKTCGRSTACHMGPTGGGGVILVTAPATVAAADKIANVGQVACVGPLDSFQPPAGSFLTFFCTNATTPTTSSTHVPSRFPAPPAAGSFTMGDCTAMFNWVASGGTGNLPTCQ